MRVVLLFELALVALATAFVEVQRGYHEEIGIPLASKIRSYEDALQLQLQKGRIVGGVISDPGAHPYFVGVLINFVNITGHSICGASLLSTNRAVTAAHCWSDGRNQASLFTTILGSNLLFSGGVRIPTDQVTQHPQWNPTNRNNDIAMIFLPTSVALTPLIQPVSIPNSSELNETFVGLWATACGFGRTSDSQVGASTMVSEVDVQVIHIAECQGTYGTVFIQSSTICTNGTGGIGICQGDSGGPLVSHYNGRLVLIGVSSFAAQPGCQLGHPSAFARITSYRNFILEHL